MTTTWRMFSDRCVARRSRHGMISDSSEHADETFDCPCRRSTKMIGTSPIRQPLLRGLEQHLDEKRVAVRDHRCRAAAARALRGASSGSRSCSRWRTGR